VVSVDDDEIRAAQTRFARDAGFAVETASATTLAGARRLAADGVIGPDDRVVLVATGTGLKESTGTSAPDPAVVALDDLAETLATRFD
jgi:threonine synthase